MWRLRFQPEEFGGGVWNKCSGHGSSSSGRRNMCWEIAFCWRVVLVGGWAGGSLNYQELMGLQSETQCSKEKGHWEQFLGKPKCLLSQDRAPTKDQSAIPSKFKDLPIEMGGRPLKGAWVTPKQQHHKKVGDSSLIDGVPASVTTPHSL